MIKYISIIIICIYIISCNFNDSAPDRAICTSNIISIDDAKHLGVFIKNCYPKKVKISDSIIVEIANAWYEYNFLFSDLENDYKLKDDYVPTNYHLVLRVKGDFSKNDFGYNNHWCFDNLTFIGLDTIENISVFISSENISVDINPIKDSFPVTISGIIQSIDKNKFDQLYNLDTFYIR